MESVVDDLDPEESFPGWTTWDGSNPASNKISSSRPSFLPHHPSMHQSPLLEQQQQEEETDRNLGTLLTIIPFPNDYSETTITTTANPTADLPSSSTSSPIESTAPLEDKEDEPTPSLVRHLVLTEARLLSGELNDCRTATDPSCQGGVAAVAACVRHDIPPTHSTLVFPKLEKQSQFVQVHPLGWNVNRLILQGLLHWKILMSTPSLLLQNERDGYGSPQDLTYLQDSNFPLLLTNVAVPPSNTWGANNAYHHYVYWDDTTQIALMSIANSGEPLTINQVQAAWGALWTIADENRHLGCLHLSPIEAQQQALYDSYQEIYVDGSTTRSSSNQKQQQKCWIPVVFFDDGQPGKFQAFIEGILQHPHPPALIIDVDNNLSDLYPEPTLVEVEVSTNSTTSAPENNINTATSRTTSSTATTTKKKVWIHSFNRKDDKYYQHDLHINPHYPDTDGNDDVHLLLTNVTWTVRDLEALPDNYKDDLYVSHISFLRQQADQAIQNDPQVGYSTEFPIARVGNYRRCQAGECEIGNLFTDALRWYNKAQVAFVTSGGLRGEGWPAGPVHMSHIWSALPFPNSLCTGIMSGRSLFALMDYSIGIATFEGDDTNDGGRLVQISGMQVEYNTQLPRGSSRILSIHIWDHEVQDWVPIERLKLYHFATDSYLCSAYDPFPDLLGANGNFTLTGEIPGSVGDELIQNVVAQYLQHLEQPYDAGILGRLVNNTDDGTEVLNLIQTQDDCPAHTYWSERQGTCFPCPDSTHVAFSDERIKLEGQYQEGLGYVHTTNIIYRLEVSLICFFSHMNFAGLLLLLSCDHHRSLSELFPWKNPTNYSCLSLTLRLSFPVLTAMPQPCWRMLCEGESY
jgi:hypothetical protein